TPTFGGLHMRPSCTLVAFALVATGLVIGSPRATDLAYSEPQPRKGPQVIRVLYLQGMDAHEASTLVRTQVPIERLAELRDSNELVLAGAADKVDQCERLLKQRGVIARTAEPHKPIEFDRLAESPIATRVFRASKDVRDVQVLFRTLYDLRDLNVLVEE